jgi:two-component system, NarL family, response regulator YdfI
VTRVLVVAPSAVLRAGLEAILRDQPGIEVAGSAPLSLALVDTVGRLEPDIVLLETEPGQEPLGPTLPALPAGAGPPALVLLTDAAGDSVSEALRLGVRAVLTRDAQPEEIVAAVEAAAAGLIVLDAPGADVLLSQMPAAARTAPQPGTETLTPREIEVLGLMAEGEGNKQIARHLGISEHTVKFHVGSILAKLGAGSRTEAVTLGLRQGLIMV